MTKLTLTAQDGSTWTVVQIYDQWRGGQFEGTPTDDDLPFSGATPGDVVDAIVEFVQNVTDDPMVDVVRMHGGVAPDTKPEDR
jgi:hypothetical protein